VGGVFFADQQEDWRTLAKQTWGNANREIANLSEKVKDSTGLVAGSFIPPGTKENLVAWQTLRKDVNLKSLGLENLLWLRQSWNEANLKLIAKNVLKLGIRKAAEEFGLTDLKLLIPLPNEGSLDIGVDPKSLSE
jgi:ABC-type glycerol-3-phosphate transport system substrate-binding protein